MDSIFNDSNQLPYDVDPPIFHTALCSQQLLVGQTLYLETQLTPINDPKLQIEFYLNGNQIQEGGRIQTHFFNGFAFLTINGVLAQDAGCYVFRAINDAGVAETSTTVLVFLLIDTSIYESGVAYSSNLRVFSLKDGVTFNVGKCKRFEWLKNGEVKLKTTEINSFIRKKEDFLSNVQQLGSGFQQYGNRQQPGFGSRPYGYVQQPGFGFQQYGNGQQPGSSSQQYGYLQQPGFSSQLYGYGQQPGSSSQQYGQIIETFGNSNSQYGSYGQFNQFPSGSFEQASGWASIKEHGTFINLDGTIFKAD